MSAVRRRAVHVPEVPVLLRGTLSRTAPVQPMYYLGPTVGLALGAGAGFKAGGKKVLTELR